MSLNNISNPTITLLSNECGVITTLPMNVICETTNPTSFDSSDGEVSVLISGGTPPYVVTWNNGSLSQGLTNLKNGSYTATTVDYYKDYTSVTVCEIFTSKDCSFSGSSEIFIPPPILCFEYVGDGPNILYQCSVQAQPILHNGRHYWSLNGCPTAPAPEFGYLECPPIENVNYIWWDNFEWNHSSSLGGGTLFSKLSNPGLLPIEILGTYEWVYEMVGTCAPEIRNSFSGPCISLTSTPTPTPTPI